MEDDNTTMTTLLVLCSTDALDPQDVARLACVCKTVRAFYVGKTTVARPLEFAMSPEWYAWTIDFAIESNNVFLLQYAEDHGIEWRIDHPNGTESGSGWICEYSSYHGHLDVIKFAFEHGCRWSVQATYWAVKHKHSHVLEWGLATLGRDFPKKALTAAIAENDTALVDFILQRAPWVSRLVMRISARIGSLAVITWALSKGFRWGETTATAAFWGKTHILSWGLKNGIPVDLEEVRIVAEFAVSQNFMDANDTIIWLLWREMCLNEGE